MDLVALEHESLHLALDRIADCLELHRAHGEDLGHQAVELVEAAPGAAGRETLVDVAQRQVVHLRSCIDHVACLCHGIRQVLGAFRLPGACGASRRAAHAQMEGLSGRDVDAVCERRHHESRPVAQVLVAVGQLCVGNLHGGVVLLLEPVALQHAHPLEGILGGHLLIVQALLDVSIVRIQGDGAHDLHAVWFVEVSHGEHDERQQQMVLHLPAIVYGCFFAALKLNKTFLHELDPGDQLHQQGNLRSLAFANEVSTLSTILITALVVVSDNVGLGKVLQGLVHPRDAHVQVDLHLAQQWQVLWERNILLADTSIHAYCRGSGSRAVRKLQTEAVDGDEELWELRNDFFWLIAITQHIQQVLGRHEVEARKRPSLAVHELVECLLAHLQG
mmetsp:Transcript_41935/g.67883  ORF Transcript_41935/g.67883 Transcript_41935/m.67883 type:complete len:390 (+) Transcript_41935:5576-6745(+)